MTYQGPTSIEQLLIDELNRRKIKYEFQYPFSSLTLDFAFPEIKLCVEADGIYWHNISGAKDRDKRRDWVLKNRGWLVLRFTGDQIRESPERCVNLIERAIIDLSDNFHF